MLAQGPCLYIAHHGVQFRSRVTDRRAGAEHNAFAAGDLVQVLALHEQVCGLLALCGCNPRHILHLCLHGQILELMRFVHHE